jgi:heat shock protein HtpX
MARTRQRRSELFPPDRGLQARMLMAIVLTPTFAIGGSVFLLLKLDGWHWWLFVGLASLGLVFCVTDLVRAARGEPLAPGAEPELWAIVDRLCVTADLPRPELVLEESGEPNSWVVDLPGRRPRLHVTRKLLDLLEPAELEAVIAHELAHIAHRDATVMTVTGLPGDALYRVAGGGGGSWNPGGAIGFLARFGSLALSRHRELAADRGAAMLTGRPSALASALLKMSGVLVPEGDLRGTGWQSLNLLPAREEDGWWSRPFHTHPRVEKRIAKLEKMEMRLAAARVREAR